MRIIKTDSAGVTIQLSVDERRIVNNALNEVCNGIHFSDAEFSTRMGATREEARAVLEGIKDAP